MKSYNVKEIAKLLRTNPETVRRWIRKGKLKATKGPSRTGGSSVSGDSLQAFLDEYPKYAAAAAGAASSPAVRIAASAIAVAGGALAVKKGSDNAIESAAIDTAQISAYLAKEAHSLRESIARKKKTIAQITEEVEKDERRLEEIQSLLGHLKNQETSNHAGKVGHNVKEQEEKGTN